MYTVLKTFVSAMRRFLPGQDVTADDFDNQAHLDRMIELGHVEVKAPTPPPPAAA